MKDHQLFLKAVLALVFWFLTVTLAVNLVAIATGYINTAFTIGLLLLGAGLWVISTRSKL